jgi:hypothetical protein
MAESHKILHEIRTPVIEKGVCPVRVYRREKGLYKYINVDPVRIEVGYMPRGEVIPGDGIVQVNFYPAQGTYPVKVEGNLITITELFAEIADSLKEISRGNRHQPAVMQDLRPQEAHDQTGDVDGTKA